MTPYVNIDKNEQIIKDTDVFALYNTMFNQSLSGRR